MITCSVYQQTGPTFYFYAVTNHKIKDRESLKDGDAEVRNINFINNESIDDPLEMKVNFYVSVENAKEKLQAEISIKISGASKK